MILFKKSMLGLFAVMTGFVLIGYADGSQYDIKNDACPKGNYYDPECNRCRSFPGGGKVVHIDHYKRCSKNYLGPRVHPLYHQYYYICKKDSVVFGKCPTDQIFNSTIRNCINPFGTKESNEDNSPNCENSIGGHPISNCSLFYVCKSDGKNYFKKLIRCPGNKITPEDHFDDFDVDIFPECKCPGRFRSPADCSLYYTCSAKTNGKYYQTRYRCPAGTLYDMGKEKCIRKHHVNCQYIPIEESLEQCVRYGSGDDSGEVSESNESLGSEEILSPSTLSTLSTEFLSTTNITEILTSTIPYIMKTTDKTSPEQATSTLPTLVFTTTQNQIASTISPTISPDEYEGSSSDYFSGEQTDYPSLEDVSESSSTIINNSTGDDGIMESTTMTLEPAELSTESSEEVTASIVPNDFDTTYDSTGLSTEQNISNSSSDSYLESTAPIDIFELSTLNSEEYSSSNNLDLESTTIAPQQQSTIENEDISSTNDLEFTITTTDMPELSSQSFEEPSTTELNEISTNFESEFTTPTDLSTIDTGETNPAFSTTEPTTDFFSTEELPEITTESQITEIGSTQQYDTTSFEDSDKSTTLLDNPGNGSEESSFTNAPIDLSETTFPDDLNFTPNLYESSSPEIEDQQTTEQSHETSTEFSDFESSSQTTLLNVETTEFLPSIPPDSSDILGMTPTESFSEALTTESDIDYYESSSKHNTLNTTEDSGTDNEFEYSTIFSTETKESYNEITTPDMLNEDSTFVHDDEQTTTEDYSFSTESSISESYSQTTFNVDTTEFLPPLPTDSSEISESTATGSSLIKEDHSTHTYTNTGSEEDEDGSNEETTNYSDLSTTSAPMILQNTTLPTESEENGNQTAIEKPCKNATIILNNNSSSSYHFEDKSFETINLEISKPLKLLLNIKPKNNCKNCFNAEDNTSPLTDTTSRSSDKKSIYLHF